MNFMIKLAMWRHKVDFSVDGSLHHKNIEPQLKDEEPENQYVDDVETYVGDVVYGVTARVHTTNHPD